MKYRPSEIAEEIGLSVDTIYRSYIPAGLPHEVDDAGSIWIVGTEFSTWANQNCRKEKNAAKKMLPNQALCMSCRAAIEFEDSDMVDAKVLTENLKIVYVVCKKCGRKATKIVKR